MLHVTGSRRLGCALPGGDLDLITVLPGPVDLEVVEARVRAALLEAASVRRVEAIRVPGLELWAAGLDVDLTSVDAGATPPEEAVARRLELGEAAAMALSAVTDADAVLEAVEAVQDSAAGVLHHEAFLNLARSVNAWARVTGLDAARFGGLPGALALGAHGPARRRTSIQGASRLAPSGPGQPGIGAGRSRWIPRPQRPARRRIPPPSRCRRRLCTRAAMGSARPHS